MSAYMDTAHYRVNKFASVVRALVENGDRSGIVCSVMGIRLTVDDLEAVIRESAHLHNPLNPAISSVEAEREELRGRQAAAVMPMIGPLLDAWEGLHPDRHGEIDELDRYLRRIHEAMENPCHPKDSSQ